VLFQKLDTGLVGGLGSCLEGVFHNQEEGYKMGLC